MTLFLGIDAGGTSSKSRLTDEQGNVLGSGKGGPANTRIGLDALHDDRRHAGARPINGGGQAGGAGTENEHLGGVRGHRSGP